MLVDVSVALSMVSERNQDDPAGVVAAVAVVEEWMLVFLIVRVDDVDDIDVQEATKDGAIASKTTNATGSRRSRLTEPLPLPISISISISIPVKVRGDSWDAMVTVLIIALK